MCVLGLLAENGELAKRGEEMDETEGIFLSRTRNVAVKRVSEDRSQVGDHNRGAHYAGIPKQALLTSTARLVPRCRITKT